MKTKEDLLEIIGLALTGILIIAITALIHFW